MGSQVLAALRFFALRVAAAALLALALAGAAIVMLASPMVAVTAYAETVLSVNPAPGETGVSVDPGPFTLQFDHNVAGSSVFDANASHVYLIAADGTPATFTVYADFDGSVPDQDNPDADFQRRFLYVQASGLKPETVYRFGVTSGIRSQGGNFYGAYEITFVTGPDPNDDGAGGGTGGGDDGGSETGEGGSGVESDGAAGGDAGDFDQSGVQETDDIVYQAPTDDPVVREDAAEVDAGAPGDAGESASGGAGGVLYKVDADSASNRMEEAEAPEPFAQWSAVALAVLLSVLVLCGAGVRMGRWRKGMAA